MTMLQPIIDFKSVKEVKDLPVYWISTHKVDIKKAGEYEKQCKARGKTPSSEEIAKLLGNNIVHLRQHTLENGIRYVTIHQEDGTEIHDDRRYGGLFTCNCGEIHDSPCVRSAIWDLEKKPDLGDGFRLIGTHTSDNPKRDGAIESFVEKEYDVSEKKAKVHYSIRPPYKDLGDLYFEFNINAFGQLTSKVLSFINGELKDEGETTTDTIIAKNITMKFWSPRKNKGKKESLILVAHNLANNFGDAFLEGGCWDQIQFEFDNQDRLEGIVGASRGKKPNPEWNSEPVLTAMKKSHNGVFRYTANSSQAMVLTQAVFGQDITRLQYDTRESLSSLMEAAIKETDIDLTKTLKFL